MFKFCKADGCTAVAIGVSRWDPELDPVSDLCREHYLAGVEMVRCEVIGQAKIVDVRTDESVGKGGVVELDPLQTNIAVLAGIGFVKVLPPEKPKKPQGSGQQADKSAG